MVQKVARGHSKTSPAMKRFACNRNVILFPFVAELDELSGSAFPQYRAREAPQRADDSSTKIIDASSTVVPFHSISTSVKRQQQL